jgi:hypothetical protein
MIFWTLKIGNVTAVFSHSWVFNDIYLFRSAGYQTQGLVHATQVLFH